jgi:cell division protein FtsN
MEFLRRNWVDLLMALLIAAVIAAVLFLLLSGGKLFKPASNTVSNAPSTVSTPVVVPPNDPTNPSSPEIPASTKKPTQVVVPKPASSSSTAKPTVKPVTSSNTKPTAKPTNPSNTKPVSSATKPIAKPSNKSSTTKPISIPEVPTINTSTKTASAKKPVVQNVKPKTTISKTPNSVKPVQKVAAPVTDPKPKVTTAKTPTTPVASSSKSNSRVSYLSSYRIVVGSYKTKPRAETFAAQVRAQGFPARAVLSQYLYLVIVGPYSGQNSAENAFARLKNTYPGAILYRPNGSRSGSVNNKKTATPRKIMEGSSSKPATLNSTLAKQPVKASMTASKNLAQKTETNPKIETAYLQVGAFKNAASASPLLINLRKAGYSARLRVSSNGVTRVVIGPLTGTPLELARNDLRTRGLQPFTIR